MTHLVAVYGSLRAGHGNHRLLEGYELLSRELSPPIFKMISLGGFPGLLDGTASAVLEMYDVSEDTFSRLDMLEGYPHFYNRKQVSTSVGDAWVYFLEEEEDYADRPVVQSGDWTQYNQTTWG